MVIGRNGVGGFQEYLLRARGGCIAAHRELRQPVLDVRCGVGHVDVTVGGELRIDSQPAYSPLTKCVDRQCDQWLREDGAVGRDDLDRAALLTDDDPSVRQKAEVHRRVQARGDDGALVPDEDGLGLLVSAGAEQPEGQQVEQPGDAVDVEPAACVADGDVEHVLSGEVHPRGVVERAAGIDRDSPESGFGRGVCQFRRVGVDRAQIALDMTVHDLVLSRVVGQGRRLIVQERVGCGRRRNGAHRRGRRGNIGSRRGRLPFRRYDGRGGRSRKLGRWQSRAAAGLTRLQCGR